MPLTLEQRDRLEELREQERLSPEETKELETLEKLEPPDPGQDEFDDAWDNDNFDSASDDHDDANADDDQDDQDDGDDDEDLDNQDTLDDGSDDQASTDGQDDDEPLSPEQRIAELESRLAQAERDINKANNEVSTWKGRLKAEQEAHKKTKDGQGKGSKQDNDNASPEIQDDDPELKEFFDEYPELEKPILKVVDQIVGQRLKNVQEDVRSVKATVQEDAEEKHRKAVLKAHPDCIEIFESGQMSDWISKQPKLMQSRYEQIAQTGATDEVIELFDLIKKDMKETEKEDIRNRQEEKKQKKIKDMEAVKSGVNPPKQRRRGPAKDDFDGAFDYFVEQDAKK